MATTLDELIIRLETVGGGEAAGQIGRVGQAVSRTADQARSAGAALSESFGAKMGQITFAAQALQAAIVGVGAAMAGLSGIRLASEFQTLEMGFTTLLKDAQRARDMLKELRQLGAATPFRTPELVQMARSQLASGTPASEVLRATQAIADVAATTGGGTEAMLGIGRQMAQIRASRSLQGDEVRVLADWGVNVGELYRVATGRMVGQREAIAGMQGMSGEQAYGLLIRGMEKAFGGASQRLAWGTLAGVMQNVGEILQGIMLPTGQLLLPVLQGIGYAFAQVAQAVQWVNEATGGSGALIAILSVLGRSLHLLRGAWRYVLGEVTALRNTFLELGAAARAATVATGGQAAASGASAAVGTAAAAGTAAGAGTAASARAGVWARVLGVLRGAWKGIAGIAAALAGEWLRDLIGGAWGHLIGNMLQGGGIGAAAGSIIPGVGTGIGALIGGAIGGLKTGWDYLFGGAGGQKSERTLEEIQRNTADTAQALRGGLIGGGKRMQLGVSTVEMEIALARLAGSGVG